MELFKLLNPLLPQELCTGALDWGKELQLLSAMPEADFLPQV